MQIRCICNPYLLNNFQCDCNPIYKSQLPIFQFQIHTFITHRVNALISAWVTRFIDCAHCIHSRRLISNLSGDNNNITLPICPSQGYANIDWVAFYTHTNEVHLQHLLPLCFHIIFIWCTAESIKYIANYALSPTKFRVQWVFVGTNF